MNKFSFLKLIFHIHKYGDFEEDEKKTLCLFSQSRMSSALFVERIDKKKTVSELVPMKKEKNDMISF